MKRRIVAALLRVLNSRWLNQGPCSYGFIGNVDAFSYEYLESEEKQRPGITVRTILDESQRLKSYPMIANGLTVIENGEARAATLWDIHELKQALSKERER